MRKMALFGLLSFARETRGNVAILFGLSLIPNHDCRWRSG